MNSSTNLSDSDAVLTVGIPLKSKATSRSWPVVCSLLERTLYSVAGNGPDVDVILACHENPVGSEVKLPDGIRNLTVIQAEFARPSTRREMMRDKGKKTALIGMEYAARGCPGFYMGVDADDLISNRIVDMCNQHPTGCGWVIRRGWKWNLQTGRFDGHRGFNDICGTCNIVNYTPDELQHLDDDMNKDRAGQRCHMRLGHGAIAKVRDAVGKPLEDFPGYGAIYVIGTGENHSGGVSVRGNKEISEDIVAEFNMSSWYRPD